MSQNNTDFSNDMSGVELLDDYLTPLKENINTSNSGVQRPSYAVAGTKWLDTSVTPWLWKMYDGEKDVLIGKVGDSFQPATPLTTAGDILVQGADGNLSKLAAGNAGNVLTSNGPGQLPSYQLGTYADTDLSNLTDEGIKKFVKTSGDETISGVKTFTDNITAPNIAKTDLSNVTPAQSFINTSVGWVMPDYSAGTSLSSFTATRNYIGYMRNGPEFCSVSIGGTEVAYFLPSTGYVPGTSVQFFIPKNSVVTVTGSAAVLVKFPCME